MASSPISGPDAPQLRKKMRTTADPQSRARRSHGSAMRANVLDDPTFSAPDGNLTRTQLYAIGDSTSVPQGEVTSSEESGDIPAEFDSSTSRLSFPAKQPRPDTTIPPTPAPATLDTQLEISSTSASIKLKDLLGLSYTLKASSTSITAEPDGADPHKEHVLFMRLPAEIRVMVYKYTWTVVNCPWKMTAEADHRLGCITGADFWPGPNPMTQVFYPSIILKMNTRIKEEFLHELCAYFPLQVRLGVSFTQNIPRISSIFLEHLQECQVVYYPYTPGDGALPIENFKKFKAIISDVRAIVELLQPFPCLRKTLIYIHLDYRMLLTWERSTLDVLRALKNTMYTPTLIERRVGYFAEERNRILLIGWVSGKEELSGEYRSPGYLEKIFSSWRLEMHDFRRCDSGQCKAKVKLTEIIDAIRRIYNGIASIDAQALSRFRYTVMQGARVLIVLFFRLPEFPEPETAHGFWRRIIYTLLFRHQVDNCRVCMGFLLLRDAWMNRGSCYSHLQILLYACATRGHNHATKTLATARRFGAPAVMIKIYLRFQRGLQLLANISAPGQMAHASTHNGLLPRIWYCIKRLISFFIDVFFGLVFQVYLHITAWFAIPMLLSMPLLVFLSLPGWTTELRDTVLPYSMFSGHSFVHAYLYPPDCDFSSEQPFHFFRTLGCVLGVFLWPYFSVHSLWQPIMSMRANHLLEMSLARWRVVGDIRDFVSVARGAASWIATSIPTPAENFARVHEVFLWAFGFAIAMPVLKALSHGFGTALVRLLPVEIWEVLFEIVVLLESFVCAWVWKC